ncbi:MAG TPA: hypothetical protein VN760_00865 [Casimicrobiaceae bacterium]|jgi:uncharacterized membrane protein|nr:hypothetical protein [Casimicrobiaceae bacterium]
MADYPAAASTNSTTESRQPPATGALVAYILFGIAALVGFAGHGFLSLVGIVGVVVAYVSRGDLRGTWAESHLTWLIRTFWWSLLWNVIGGVVVLGTLFLGYPIAWVIWVATAIWVIYRVVRGFLLFNDRRPIPAM